MGDWAAAEEGDWAAAEEGDLAAAATEVDSEGGSVVVVPSDRGSGSCNSSRSFRSGHSHHSCKL